ncbi:MAG: aldehyde dehydrogenase, partial [Bradyrhizobium sp.]|nr:aldehyde dehydrogenase [Bradyrhizobium sp.]
MTVAEKVSDGVSRRVLLTGGLAGGFLLAFHLPVRALAPNEPVQPPDDTAGKFAPNAFIRIDTAGKTTLVMPQVEMGQGLYTAVAMILAEELDADFSSVVLEHAPANEKLYANPAFGIQATGGSTSVRVFWKPLREAGAAARAMLVQAAAQQWQVDPASCTTSNGEVTHKESGRKLSYSALAAAASTQTPPKDAALKDPKDFVLIGKPLKRFDTPDKANGKVVYGIDAILPDMKFATLKGCPVFGGKVGKVDDSAAKKIPGVRKIVVLDDLVAVVGDHRWAATKGLDALVIDWNEGPNAHISSKDIWRDLRAASEKDVAVAKSEGDIAKALATGDRLDASYELPFLAHAPMEPLNATVHLKPDSCEIWVGTQIMSRVQSEAAKAAGLPVEKVIVNQHLLGGGFGRRLEPDMVVAAVRIAKQVDGPV